MPKTPAKKKTTTKSPTRRAQIVLSPKLPVKTVTLQPGGGSSSSASGMPPSPGAPTPPAGFVPLDRIAARSLSKPAPIQVASGAAVSTEITASKTYTKDFSANAPPAAEVAQLLTVAEAWTNEEKAAEAWYRCASTQKQLTWDAALKKTEQLQGEYAYADAHDATIPARYPELTRFLKAKQTLAQHAVETKRAEKKKAAKADPKAT